MAGRRPDERVSRARIVAAARTLLEAGGLDALSMRKLAAELGVAPTAIYWHIGSRDDVLHAVLDALLADLPAITPRGRTPRARIASVARAIRRQAETDRLVQSVAQEVGRGAEVSFPGQVALAREMEAAGVRGADAAQAVRAILFMVGGFVLLADNFAHRREGSRTTQELWRAVEDPELDDELRAAMSRPASTDDLFDYALDRLLESILPA